MVVAQGIQYIYKCCGSGVGAGKIEMYRCGGSGGGRKVIKIWCLVAVEEKL